MRKPLISYAIVVLIGLMAVSCSKNTNPYVPVDAFEGGTLMKSPSGSFYIVQLNGTFHQMGRQYGMLLKQQINDFYDEAINGFLIGQHGVSYEDLVTEGQRYYADFQPIFRDYLDGMAETNGLGPDKTYILSEALPVLAFLGCNSQATTHGHSVMGCSSLSAWGEYTPDGYTVTGRNLDLPFGQLRNFSEYFHVVIWNPVDYPASVASIDFVGGLFYQTAINSKGIFLELQNGENSDTNHPIGRENANNLLLESLFRNTTSEEYDRWFQTVLPDAGLIMNGSYPGHATIYEWATFRVAARNTNGLISASNDFIDSSWVNYPIFWFDSINEGIGYTWTRRTNLLKLGEQHKGSITPQQMMEIFDQTIPNGGATFPEGGLIKTIYSVVTQPAELKIWLKVREYSGWEEIDLKPLMTEK